MIFIKKKFFEMLLNVKPNAEQKIIFFHSKGHVLVSGNGQ